MSTISVELSIVRMLSDQFAACHNDTMVQLAFE